MNNRQILSISLLLALPSCLLNANDKSIEAVLRHQQEMCSNQSDIKAGVVYLLARMYGPKDGNLGIVNDRVCKIAVKQLAGHHVVPDGLRDVRAELPGVGEVTIVNEDQLLEVAYATVCAIMAGKNSREDVSRVMLLTYGREKILQLCNWLMTSMSGQALVADGKNNWDLRTGVKELCRYVIDRYLDSSVK